MENYNWKSDSFYYGDIPDGVTREQLVGIMTRAVHKVQVDQKTEVGKHMDFGDFDDILDRWFEHDAKGENRFDSVVPEEDFDNFIRAVKGIPEIEPCDDKNCIVCSEEYKEGGTCHICKNLICAECEDITMSWGEGGWFEVSMGCDVCKKLTCPSCMIVCYDCAGSGEEIEYCEDCVPEDLIDVSCEYHEWWTCGKHEDVGCPQCNANRGFAMRYGP